jgi:hypothetical protein
VPVRSVKSSETGESRRAFLWIPPNCDRVRGVVIGQQDMEENYLTAQTAERRIQGAGTIQKTAR